MRIIVGWMGALLLAMPVAARADCAAEAGNLLAGKDCGFARGIEGWRALDGQGAAHEAGAGGALAGRSAGGSLSLSGPCVAVEAGASYRFAARVRSAEGTAYFCSLNLYEHEGGACDEGSAAPLAGQGAPPGSGWEAIEGAATTGAATGSARLRLDCSGEDGFAILLDEVVLARR